jgi:tight adherence protein B
MRRALVGVALLAASAVAAPATLAGVAITGVDTSGYPEVRLTVVEPLGSSTPQLTENGRPAAGVQAVNLGRTKSVVLAVDRSQSMTGVALSDATSAAEAFVAAKAPADRVEVIGFGRRAFALTRFSSSTADAGAALGQLRVDDTSGTAVWDAVVMAARGLRHEDRPGHLIILLTDGRDVSSSASFAQAVAAARAARAAVYTIGISGPDFTPAPLRALSRQTGGVFHVASSSAQLASLYASIARSLAGTWQLRYPTAARPGAIVRLEAASNAGSGKHAVAIPRTGVSGAEPTPPSTVLPRSAWSSRLAPVVVALLAGLLMLVACAFVLAARSGVWLNARLAPHLGPTARRSKARKKRDRKSLLRGVFAATEQAFANVKQFRALQRMLTRADLPLLAAELLYICLGSGVVLGLLAGVMGAPSVLVLCFMLVGAAVPISWVAFKAGGRVKAFDNQLPDLLITIAASLKAGHSFRHAIQAVVDEGAEPAAKEFRRVITETRLGRPMDAALAEMSERIGSKNLSFVLNAVTIQRQIGGSLAGLFDMVAETVRQRQQFARKIRGLTAMGRLSAYVLAGLPFLVAIAVTVINPTYMAPLWHSRVGHDLVAVGIVMLATGTVILKKIVSFRG